MNLLKEFRKLILPILRRFYWVALTFGLAVAFATHYVKYATPMYESVSRIKLDDKKVGISNNNLYYDFDVFGSINRVETEVEVLKSRMLWERVLTKLHFELLIYRKGKLKKTLLYDDSPLYVTYNFVNREVFDKTFSIQVLDNKRFSFTNLPLGFNNKIYSFGDTIHYKRSQICISKNEEIISLRDLQLVGPYEIEVLSPETLISTFNEKNIDIVAIDKEIAVIRIAFKSDNPQKAADFANALAEEYISDYISSKSLAAAKTLQFIDERLKGVKKELVNSELKLELFKKKFGVINTIQETETGIRKMGDFQVQLTNIEMNEAAISALEKYLESGEYFDQTATQFGFGDLTFTELVKKLALYNEERRKLLMIYTEKSPEIKNLDDNIQMVKSYIRAAIHQAKTDIELKKNKINDAYDKSLHQFDGLPVRERNFIILEREFHLNERIYNFLEEKRMEASIAQAALISFHRIIQKASPSEKPVSPNKTLILFVSGLFGLIIGIVIAFTHDAVTAKIGGRADIDKLCSVPVLGVMRRFIDEPQKMEYWLLSLAKQISLRMNQPHAALAVTSGIRLEGKTTISKGIAQAFAQMNKRVAWVDLDTTKNRDTGNGAGIVEVLENKVNIKQVCESLAPNLDVYALGAYEQGCDSLFTEEALSSLLADLRKEYDILVLDAPSMLMSINGYFILRKCDRILYLFRSRHTKLEFVSFADQVKQACDPVPMELLLNDVKGSLDFTGQYQGGTFTGLPVWKRVLNWIEIPKIKFSMIKRFKK